MIYRLKFWFKLYIKNLPWIRLYARKVIIHFFNYINLQSRYHWLPHPHSLCYAERVSRCWSCPGALSSVVMNWAPAQVFWFGTLHFRSETPHLCLRERPGNKRVLFTDYKEERRGKRHITFIKVISSFRNDEKCHRYGGKGDKMWKAINSNWHWSG